VTLQPVAQAGKTQLFRIPLPTPWGDPVYPCLLLDADHAVLVDTGCQTEASREALLAALDRQLGDRKIDAIVMTHAHQDHYGGLDAVQPRNHSPVLCWTRAREYYETYPKEILDRPRLLHALCDRLGVKGARREQVTSGFDSVALRSAATLISGTLEDGETLRIGGLEMVAHHHPGHHHHTLVLEVPALRAAITADNLFAGHLSPPTVEFCADGRRRQGLPLLVRSLNRLAQLDINLAVPSHGDLIDTPSASATKAAAAYQRHAERIAKLSQGHRGDLVELLQLAFGEIPLPLWGLRMAFLLGYLDLAGLGDELR
jgi:glyoxylase-like metal-dependent hydrolase (beta-lactamase superfamily II)